MRLSITSTLGEAQKERFDTMERTIPGRIDTAKLGKCHVGRNAYPVGRAWVVRPGQELVAKKKQLGDWVITDRGKAIAKALQRYVNGEGSAELARELGIRADKFSQWIHHGQLAGPYYARFKCDDLELEESVLIPDMPEVVSIELLEKAKARAAFNRRNNRTGTENVYYLAGFLRCYECHLGLYRTYPAWTQGLLSPLRKLPYQDRAG